MAECILVGNGGSNETYDLQMTNIGYFLYPTDVIVPSNVISLSASNNRGGFYQHTEIETISFEDASVVTSLSAYLCDGCTNLVSFQVPANITSINSYAFRNTRIATITIPSGVINVGDYAFYGCPASDITWESDDNSIAFGQYAFGHTNITDAGVAQVFAKGRTFGAYIFEHCDNITTATTKDTAHHMFYYCTNLKSVIINDPSDHKLGQYVCGYCSSLETVTILSGTTTIDSYSFYSCTSLETVNLPNTITTIGNQAFYNNISLQTITLPNSITSFNPYAFQGCTSLTNITLGADWDCACSFSQVTTLTATSIVGMLNSLKDLTGGSSKTLILGATNLAKVTAEEQAIATAKNWILE